AADSVVGPGGWGIFVQGTDRLTVAHNLVWNCQNSGLMSTVFPRRIVTGRGGTARENQVLNNIFGDYGEIAVALPNEHNRAEGNLYSGRSSGSLRVLFPEPPQMLDLPTWREFHGWDQRGGFGKAQAALDPDRLMLTLSIPGGWRPVEAVKDLTRDFFGVEAA